MITLLTPVPREHYPVVPQTGAWRGLRLVRLCGTLRHTLPLLFYILITDTTGVPALFPITSSQFQQLMVHCAITPDDTA